MGGGRGGRGGGREPVREVDMLLTLSGEKEEGRSWPNVLLCPRVHTYSNVHVCFTLQEGG